MDFMGKQNEIKIDILQSLARSQRALAAIIESVADISKLSPRIAEGLLENLQEISGYQKILAAKLAGIHLHERKQGGLPAKPWLHRSILKKPSP